MKRNTRIAVCLWALLALPLLMPLVQAGTSYVGQIVQQVTFGGVSQPVNITAGSSTIGTVNQGTANTVANGWPIKITDGTNTASVTASSALKVDGSAVTQPVSGTVTANIGTTNGLALDTSVNGILASQGSTTAGQKGPLIQGAVTTASPAYTTAQTSPLSLTTAGALRVDGSATTQPVSGTVSLGAGTAAIGNVFFSASATATETRVTATTTSGSLLASNASRHALECESLCTNTDRVFIKLGGGTATSSNKPLEVCSSWQAPPGVAYTGALQVVSNSGSQAIHCVEY